MYRYITLQSSYALRPQTALKLCKFLQVYRVPYVIAISFTAFENYTYNLSYLFDKPSIHNGKANRTVKTLCLPNSSMYLKDGSLILKLTTYNVLCQIKKNTSNKHEMSTQQIIIKF